MNQQQQQVIAPRPHQSAYLQQINIPTPPDITAEDGADPAVLLIRKRQGRDYLSVIQSKRMCDEGVLVTDVDEAEDYELNSRLVGSTRLAHIQLGPMLEAINGTNLRIDNLATQMQQGFTQISQRFTQIDQRFTQIDQRFTQIDQRFTQIERRLGNATANRDSDDIEPPQVGDIPPPGNFPTTIAALQRLEVGELLTNMENYYGLPHTSGLSKRLRRVRRAYGVGTVVMN